MQVILVRHGESVGNASGVIQGHGSSPLSPRGRDQAKSAAERLAAAGPFDLVVSSDMERALETAHAYTDSPRLDPVWREMDLGAWDGVPIAELRERFPDELKALIRGEPVRIGGTGESIPSFTDRVRSGLERIAAETDGTALVFAHGGVIERAVAIALGRPTAVAFAGRVSNTSFTALEVDGAQMRVLRYNDATHLGAVTGWAAERLEVGDTVAALIRHGETDANRTGTWQGRTDGGLSSAGRKQAEQLAQWYGGVGTLYASSLGRAVQTAESMSAAAGPVISPDLVELSMGSWEGRTVEEITSGWPELWDAIYRGGQDVPRGGDGETWGEMVDRVSSAIEAIVEQHPGEHLGIVSHGAAIRGYCASLLKLGHEDRRRLAAPRNTSVSHIVHTEGRAVLSDYNVGPL